MSSSGKSVVVVENNKVFTVMKNIFVFDLNNGTELYKSYTMGTHDNYVNPIISNNKMKFILGNELYSIDTNDYTINIINLYSILSGANVLSTMAVDSSDNIYFGTEHGRVISITNAGIKNWEYSLGNTDNITGPFFRSSPAIDESNGLLYIGTKANSDSKFLAIRLNDGNLAWTYNVGGDVYSSPTIGNNGNIYFGSETRNVYSLNSKGELNWKVGVGQDITWPSPTIDNEGIIYIGGMGGKVYAIQTDSSGLSTESWPTIHKNSQNNAVK